MENLNYDDETDCEVHNYDDDDVGDVVDNNDDNDEDDDADDEAVMLMTMFR